MRKQLPVVFLLSTAVAQVFQTGPAGLARQMPQIYGPYLNNMSRVKILGNQSKPDTSSRASSDGTVFHAAGPPFVPHELASHLGKTPQEQKYIEGVFTLCLNNYLDTARRKGIPLNDVALALNYYIATNYFVYSLGKGPTPKQISATRKMVSANMAADEAFLRMSDRQKQEAYETLIVLTGFVDLEFGTAKASGNETLAAPFREMAKHNLETLFGVPVANIHFTDEGVAIN